MRSGRVTAIAGLVLMVGGCASPGGVAGISSLPPAPPADGSTVSAASAGPGTSSRPFVTTPSDQPVATPAARPGGETGDDTGGDTGGEGTVERAGDDPVRVPPPRMSSYSYVFPVKGCKATYARKLLVLPKSTIWAKKGCAFVAPIDGTVHEVNAQNRWQANTDRGPDREGRFVAIIGADGVRYLGGHLDSVAEGVRPGVKVKAGQVLGRVGDSGNAAGGAPNLYFAVSWESPAGYWWVRRGMVKPWKYLDAWFNGNRTYSPRQETFSLRKRMGGMPQCTLLCNGKPTPQPTRKPKPKPKPTEDEPIFVED